MSYSQMAQLELLNALNSISTPYGYATRRS